MFRMKVLVAACLLTVAFVVASPSDKRPKDADECAPLTADSSKCVPYWGGQRPPLLLISFDGFRYDYLNRSGSFADPESLSPALHQFVRCGVRASAMVPVYPSLTFPNHYSIVTGLFPESHGIINNNFYDPDLQLSFSLSNPNATQPWWWIGEPIWYTAKKQGKKSATYFWPGSDVKDPEREPTYWLPYDGSIPYSERIQQVLDWLDLPIGERPDYLTLYLDEPDHTGHGSGPDSANVSVEIADVDHQLQTLLNGMDALDILGCVDIMVVSDHGMASTPAGEFVVFLDKYVANLQNTTRIYDGVFPNIRPNSDTQEEQDRIGKALECQDPNMRVYSKWDLPRRHHYFNTNRIPSILLDMTVRWRAYNNREYVLLGNHGWDNLNDEMQAMFVAYGPSFRRGLTIPAFHNYELYNLMCALLGIDPAPNNGTWGALHHLLVFPPEDPAVDPPVDPSILAFPQNQASYYNNLDRLRCSLLTRANDLSTDSSLNLNPTQIEQAQSLHSPWGLPQPGANTSSVPVLVNENRVTGFDVQTGLPRWVSYTVQQVREASSEVALRLDVRLDKSHKGICDRFEAGNMSTDSILISLFPLAYSSARMELDVQIDTNVIECPPSFQSHWNRFHDLISQLVADYGAVNVIVGPHREQQRSPTIFAILSVCQKASVPLSECSVEDLNVQSFILPTFARYNGDCIDSDTFLATHVASLKDIETLSRLRFFPVLPYREKANLLSRTPLASQLIVNPDPSPPPSPTTIGPETSTTQGAQNIGPAKLLVVVAFMHFIWRY